MPYKDPEKKLENAARYRIEQSGKVKKANAEWRAKHSEHLRIYIARWRLIHPDYNRKKGQERYRENGEEIKKKARENYYANQEDAKAYSRNFRKNNSEKTKQAVRTWHKAHPERMQEYHDRRRARKCMAPVNDFTNKQWESIKFLYNYRCIYCGRQMQRLTKDHVIPLSKSGSHTVSNIVPACQSCNSTKHNGPPLAMQYVFAPVTECA